MMEFNDEEWKLYGEMLEKDPVILKNIWDNEILSVKDMFDFDERQLKLYSKMLESKPITRRIDFSENKMPITECDLCNKTLQSDEKIVVSLKMQDNIPDFIIEKHWDKTYCAECFDKLISELSGTFEIYLFNKYYYVQYNKYRADILIMLNDALMSFIEQHLEEFN